MPKLGAMELGLILLVIVIVFGVGKLPDIGRQLGKGIRDFKKFSAGTSDDEVKDTVAKTEVKKSDLDDTKSKLEAAEARVKALEEAAKKPA